MNETILQVEGLTISLPRDSATWLMPVNDVNFIVSQGEILALVGESGSGKTLTAMAVGGQLPPAGKSTGTISFLEKDMLGLNKDKLADIRGKEIFYVFQNPGNVFNPCVLLGKQLHLLCRNAVKDKAEFISQICACLARIGFENPERILKCYPFQLSGGMLQRLMIACALLVKPRLLIADEPTTALDVGVQKEILRELALLREETGMAILLITHDFGVVSEIADHVVVMQNGKVVESGGVHRIFDMPQQEYTTRLLEAAQGRRLDCHADKAGSEKLEQVI